MFTESDVINEKCQPFRDLIPAYALEASEPEEIQSLEAHLKTCADCQASLEEYRAVSEGLLLALPPQAPPPRVRARLIAGLASTQAPAAPRTRRVWPIWQIAGGLALAILLVLNVSTLAQLQNLQRQQTTLTAQLRSSEAALALVAYPDGRTFSLTGQQGTGTVVLNSDLKRGVVFAWGLKAPDAAHTYQVWLIQPDGQRVSGGLFSPEPGQPFVSVVIPFKRPLSDFTGLGITLEPSGGSLAPTGPRVLGTLF
jgi:anti-sigma-K factor RskA